LRLLDDLGRQTFPAADFEVVVVDDGSPDRVASHLSGRSTPYRLHLIEQKNAGPAAARHRGICAASGEVIVTVDDDMSLPPTFLASHEARHREGLRVVLGLIRPAPDLGGKPLFERFHADQLERQVASYRAGRRVRGVHVCTGNVSFRREDYLALGGFDVTLGRSEDRDLGIRLELAGAPFVFDEAAFSIHHSDHADRKVWLKRAFSYGVSDTRIARKHEATEAAPHVTPWRFFFLVSPVTRPFLIFAVSSPWGGHLFAHAAMSVAEQLDRAGVEGLAIRGATFAYGLEYFRGVRAETGSLRVAMRALLAQRRQHQA
jgi:glycosyltransferase involved in cell wall biosynthesis